MEGLNAPKILSPMDLRSGFRYRSLRRYAFTSKEKEWICVALVSSCGDLEVDLVPAMRTFSACYDIPCKCILQWIKAYANGVDFGQAECPIDQIGANIIVECFNNGCNNGESEVEYHNRLAQVIAVQRENTARRRG